MEFNVSPMTCGRCVRAITRAIHAIDPRAEVDVDLDAGTVSIDGMLVPAQAIEAMAGAGYIAVPS